MTKGDARSDLWGLGVAVFTLIAGTPPFWAEDSEQCIQDKVKLEAAASDEEALTSSLCSARCLSLELSRLSALFGFADNANCSRLQRRRLEGRLSRVRFLRACAFVQQSAADNRARTAASSPVRTPRRRDDAAPPLDSAGASSAAKK